MTDRVFISAGASWSRAGARTAPDWTILDSAFTARTTPRRTMRRRSSAAPAMTSSTARRGHGMGPRSGTSRLPTPSKGLLTAWPNGIAHAVAALSRSQQPFPRLSCPWPLQRAHGCRNPVCPRACPGCLRLRANTACPWGEHHVFRP